MFSLCAPFVVTFIYILLYKHLLSLSRMRLPLFGLLLPLPLSLIFAGVVFGIVALALTKRREHKSVFGMALAGVCINCLVLALFFVGPVLFALTIKKGDYPTTPQGRLDKATKALAVSPGGDQRFYALGDAAKESFEVGKVEDAGEYATELLALAPRYQGNWNYGNAIQNGNLVLGRIAVREGRIQEAKQYLIAAGNSPGSPQMDTFGPNMSLAKDLIEKGERNTALQYFELCRKFWKMDYGKLDDWSKEVKAGETPDFGANLVY